MKDQKKSNPERLQNGPVDLGHTQQNARDKPPDLPPELLLPLMGTLVIVVVTPAIAGVALFGWQVFSWLQSGAWQSVSVIDAMIVVGLESEWLHSPENWLGVWKILDWLSAAGAGVAFTLVMLIAEAISEKKY